MSAKLVLRTAWIFLSDVVRNNELAFSEMFGNFCRRCATHGHKEKECTAIEYCVFCGRIGHLGINCVDEAGVIERERVQAIAPGVPRQEMCAGSATAASAIVQLQASSEEENIDAASSKECKKARLSAVDDGQKDK